VGKSLNSQGGTGSAADMCQEATARNIHKLIFILPKVSISHFTLYRSLQETWVTQGEMTAEGKR
jgi:hypothetical protein